MRPILLSTLLAASLLGPAAYAAEGPAQVTDRPKLGVQLEDVPFDASQGIPVRSVAPGSSAAALGLQAGDAIKSANGKTITGFADLVAVVGGLKVGDPVTLEVTRKGAPMTLSGKMLAPATPAAIGNELREAQEQLGQLKQVVDARTREPTLAELIRELQLLQEQFPKAAAEFKKLYPNGEFSIVIRITSDKNAPNAIDLMDPPTVPPAAETPAPDGAKPTSGAKPAPGPKPPGGTPPAGAQPAPPAAPRK